MNNFLICFIGAGRNEIFQKMDLTQNLNCFSAKINSAKSEKNKESPLPPEKISQPVLLIEFFISDLIE